MRWLRQAPPPPAQSGAVFVGPQGTANPQVGPQNPEAWYAKNVWAAIGVQRIAEAVANIPWAVELKHDGAWEPAPEHPLQRLLDHVNDDENLWLLKEATASWLMLQGNAYWWLGAERRGGPPSVIHWLVSSLVKTQTSERPPYTVGFKYFHKGQGRDAISYRRDEVLHIKRFNPADPHYGQGDLVASQSELAQYGYAGQFNEQFLAGGGIPAGILQGERMLEEPEERRVTAWLRRVTSRMRANKILVMGKGLEYHDVGKAIDDVVVKSLPTTTREAILAATGTPPSMAGLTERINYATARIQERVMYTAKAIPLDLRMLARANDVLPPRFGDDGRCRIVHDLSGIGCLQDDETTKSQAARELVTAGIKTINEVRRAYWNDGPLPWGDDWHGPISTVVVARKTGEANTIADVSGNGSEQDGQERQDEGSSGLRANRSYPAGAAGADPAYPVRHFGDEQRRAIHRAYNLNRDREAEGLRKRIAPWYEERAEEIVAALEADGDVRRSARVRQPTEEEFEFDEEEAAAALVAIVIPVLADLYGRTGQAELATVGVDIAFDLETPGARALLLAREREMKSVVETAQERVRQTLAEGLAEGEAVDDLTARVGEWMKAGKEVYAENVARTETGIVMNEAAREADRQAGASGLEWLAIVDDRTRDTHAEMDGVTVAMGERFVVGGVECDGPGDPGLPAEEICNCRCTTAAVFEG